MLDRGVELRVRRREAADRHGDRGPVARLEVVDDRLADLAASVFTAVGPSHHECAVTVSAPQRRGPAERPIGPHVDDVRLGLEPTRQLSAGRSYGRVVHRAALGGHDEHDVRLAGPETVSEQRQGLARGRRRVLEPGVAQAGEDATSDRTGHDGEGHGGQQHRAPAAYGEASRAGEQPVQHGLAPDVELK